MVDVNQTLTMAETLSMSRTGGFLEKTAELYFQALVDKGAKVVGKVVVSVGADKTEQVELPIESCPDSTATVVLSVNARGEGEQGPDDEAIVSERSNMQALRRVKLRTSPKLTLHKSERESKDWDPVDVPHSDRVKLTELTERVEELEKENEALMATNSDLKKKLRGATDEQRKKEEEWETRLQ